MIDTIPLCTHVPTSRDPYLIGKDNLSPNDVSSYIQEMWCYKLYDHFTKDNIFLKAIAKEFEKRSLHDTTLLDWDKEKHTILANLELQNHKEST